MVHTHSHTDHEHEHNHDHHGHDHSHGHSHAHSAPESFNMAFALAVTLNLLFVIIEAGYALAAHSMGLLADAGHNFGDVMGLSLAWGANLLLAKGATARFSYGFKRTTIIAALINALILIAATAIIAYESIFKLLHPVAVNEKIIIIVAAIGILINGGTALLFMRGRKEDLNIKGAFLHLAYDALIAFGVVVAGFIILFTKALWIDPLVGLLIVIAIVAGTWSLLLDSINLILDAVPKKVDHQGVKNYLSKIEGVTAVHDLHIWGLSTNEIALTVHLVMPTRELHDADFQMINHDLKYQYKINHVTIQVEKGTTDDPCGQVQTC